MTTTHSLAKQLLEMPDVPLVVEGWCDTHKTGIVASMTEYDPGGEAILISGREPMEYPEWASEWRWVTMPRPETTNTNQ